MEGKGILHTIYVCLLYFVFGSGFLAPTIAIYKHNMGTMVLQSRLPLTGIFKQAGFLWHCLYWCCMSGLETNQSAPQLPCDVTRPDTTPLKLGDYLPNWPINVNVPPGFTEIEIIVVLLVILCFVHLPKSAWSLHISMNFSLVWEEKKTNLEKVVHLWEWLDSRKTPRSYTWRL